jgi:hypothetical protein
VAWIHSPGLLSQKVDAERVGPGECGPADKWVGGHEQTKERGWIDPASERASERAGRANAAGWDGCGRQSKLNLMWSDSVGNG